MTTPTIAVDGSRTRSRPSSGARLPAFAAGRSHLFWLAAITPAILFLHGYHPFADDAGIYTAGIRKLADESLYRPDAAFVLAHTRLSIFAHLLALTVRFTHAPLDLLLFVTHLASIFIFLLACWTLATRIFSSPIARWSAVATVAACFTLPIAGTAIALMDPYVTARSFSTPLGLFAIASAIDRARLRTAFFLITAALMHPLMTFYTVAFLLLFILVDHRRLRAAVAASSLGVLLAAAVYLATLHAPVAAAYREAILSRPYLFPMRWSWMELVGIIAPLLILALAARQLGNRSLSGRLCTAATLLGSSCALSALFFVHTFGAYLLVRIQILRGFHTLYALGLLLAGGFLGELLFRHSRWQAFALLAAVAAAMWFAQNAAYPLSAHVELPGMAPRNPWQEAFLWIRRNTPRDAVFAANPHLVFIEGEDAQGFRATSERSLLADDKDEGVVVVFPGLAEEWGAQRNAQVGLDKLSDAERVARVRPFGATWLLLSARAATSFPCPYRNSVAQVCRIEP